VKAALKLPRLSMNMEEGTIAAWKRQPGERFAVGDPLYEVETEKVTTEVEAPCDGTLLEILAPAGETVAVGAEVCRIER
jgi:pyruvate/2-oxoglutarate dehydrogenase complex dihydrolipoamide acyltransferase (E2) component